MTNTYDAGWSLLDVALSPVFSILDTASEIPGINDTQFGNWLHNSTVFRGAQNFRDEQPGWAMGADFATALIPYVGWGTALNRARGAGGALQGINRAGQAAARLAQGNAPAAFALGETVRYAPISAAITGFDLAGGRYDSPVEALVNFGIGSIGGGILQAGGHAASPFISRTIGNVPIPLTPWTIGGAWDAAFTPGPELSALYGFDNNVHRAAALAADDATIQATLNPTAAPQVQAAALWDIINAPSVAHPPEVMDLLRNQYNELTRTILDDRVDAVDIRYRVPADAGRDLRAAMDSLTRFSATENGNRVRVPLTASGNRLENPDVLAAHLGLPNGWVHDTELPGLTQVALDAVDGFRRQVGLDTGRGAEFGWLRLERDGPTGSQTWSVLREPNKGQYQVVVEVPVLNPMTDIHRMTGRARYPNTQALDKAEPGKLFFSFKTRNPSNFFPHMRANFDAADEGLIGSTQSRLNAGRSQFLDRMVDLEKVYLNPNTLKAAQAAQYGTKEQKAAFVQALLAGPTAGKQIAQIVERYAMPTQFQLRGSPAARAILSTHQAAFDAAEGRGRALLHGTASIPENSNPLASLFAPANVDETEALVPDLRRTVLADPGNLELIRKAIYSDRFPLQSIAGTSAGQWLTKAVGLLNKELVDGNAAIKELARVGATDAREVTLRKGHIGISREWDGGYVIPIYAEGQVQPIALRAGHGKAQAEAKARAWIEHFEPLEGKRFRQGKPFVAGETKDVPDWAGALPSRPGLLEPRQGMRGYEHEFEPFKHVDDLIALLENGYITRQRYFASTVADALTVGKLSKLRTDDIKSWQIVDTRLAQLKGQPGPLDARMNQITDSILAPVLGTNSFTKISDAVGGFMFHMLHGMGNIATPALNMTSVLQTQLPAGVNLLTSDFNTLKGMGFQFPAMAEDGLPTRGFNWAIDPVSLLRGGFKKAQSDDPEVQEIYNVLFSRKIMGTGLANEYSGQDRTLARRASEKIRGPDDIGFWAGHASSFLMQKTEQVSRTIAAGIALQSMEMLEKSRGFRFTTAQKIENAARMVEQTNFGYFTSDRPMMYTTPLGALFGNQKTWVTNYLFMMAEYTGLAKNGNWAPLLMTLGTTTMLGGVFAVPFAGSAIDAITETFAGQDAKEYIFERLGEGGNGVSFGLPALFGMSLTGNVAAPGSNLAHDAEFFTTIVALERAKLMGRAIGRAWDDQVELGLNPFKDELLGRQMAQAFAPRAFYRTWEAVSSDQLTSAATGYPLVRDLGWGARTMHALGFRDADIAVQYSAYESLLADKEAMQSRVSGFGEQYALAMVNGDRRQMAEVLQQAGVMGLDITRVMQSANTRLRNMGLDMFGRNFNQEQLDRYQETLHAGGYRQ